MKSQPSSSIFTAIIVDDETLAREVVREHLAAYPGITIVAECRNGFDAVKAVAELKPDILFLDIQMPKLNGFELLELIDHECAIIFITAYEDDEVRARAFNAGAVAYFLKPFDGEDLLNAIDAALKFKIDGKK